MFEQLHFLYDVQSTPDVTEHNLMDFRTNGPQPQNPFVMEIIVLTFKDLFTSIEIYEGGLNNTGWLIAYRLIGEIFFIPS